MRHVAAVVVVVLVVACGQAADEGRIDAAEGYFTALAEADYGRMAQLSTGYAATAAEYGQQVLAADPTAFGPRDLTMIDPLRAGEDGAVRGELELITKGADDGGLRISDITMAESDGMWLVESYRRNGRPLNEVFLLADATVSHGGVTVSMDLALTDDQSQVLVVPISVTADAADVALIPEDTVALAGARRPLRNVEGTTTVTSGETVRMALVFGDVSRPSQVTGLDLAFDVGGVQQQVSLTISP